MGYIRPWAVWRRIQYGTGFGLFVMLCTVGVYYAAFYQPPSCFDGVQNGNETGVDCGGDCVRICAHEVQRPTVEWVNSFEVAPSQYNAVAYVQSRDLVAGTPSQPYTFRFYDAQDQLITERSGTTALPPNSTFPIFVGRVDTFNRVPVRTEIELEPADMWLPVSQGREQFVVRNFELQGIDNQPRLMATLENTSLQEASPVDVVATIFDSAGRPLTASQTFVERFSGRSTESIVFTWPNPIARTIRSCTVPTDIMMILDRSGSMAADGGDPPEPLESAKRAAEQFVTQTRSQDQVGFLSYATEPSDPIEQVLTSNKQLAQESIAQTRMGTDGIQYTNIGAAFRSAMSELRGPRARPEARQVIIFLTDGDVTRPVNPETGVRDIPYARQYALDNAQEVKDNDITVYTIGFGDFFLEIDDVLDRDLDLVAELATNESMSYIAPSIRELQRVYSEIAEDLCEDGPARIDVIPVTGTNFLPLR